MKNFNKLVFKELKTFNGVQAITHFPNGFGASIVRHEGSYGGKSGLFELAVLDVDGNILNNTDITDDIIGWQDEKDIDRLLNAIANLDSQGTLASNILL